MFGVVAPESNSDILLGSWAEPGRSQVVMLGVWLTVMNLGDAAPMRRGPGTRFLQVDNLHVLGV